ncbi:MAG: YdcF family protein, partial [Quisquiliibacterium sp.]
MILTELVSFLISPLGTMLMLAALALAFAVIRAPRLAAMLMVLGVAWVTVWSLPTPSLWLRAQVEANYPLLPIKDLPSADAIVVLGGGITPPARKNAYPDMGKAADRIWHAARLYKAGKAPLLVLSGGSDPQVSVMTEAQAMRELLLDLGVPSQAMLLETQSRNT